MEEALHPDDLVAWKPDESRLGVVERTHGDVDSHDPSPGRDDPYPINHDRDIEKLAFNRFLKDGVPPKSTVLVRWQHTPRDQLIAESKLVLVDRSLLIGDVVKKNVQDAMSGVVVNTSTSCTLQPMCDLTLRNSGRGTLRLKGLLPATEANDHSIEVDAPAPLLDVPASEIRCVESISEEDLVIYKDWIGRIVEVISAITLKLADNGVVEISDHQAEHADGDLDNFYVGDIASTKKGHIRNGRWIYGKYNANTMPIGTVVQTRNVSAEIAWLQRRIGSSGTEREPPSMLEREELESGEFQVYDKTRRPQSSADSASLETISNSEIDARLNLRVRFKDLSGACVKYDGSSDLGKVPRIDRKDTLGYDINVFDIIKFRTDVTVQWQDLSISHERSIDLEPDTGIDDAHDAWPGEIAHTLDFHPVPNMQSISQPGNVGIIQSVNASERMAKVLWCPSACLQYVEDTEGNSGIRSLLTGVVGLPGTEYQEVSLYDVEAPGAMNVRRGDMVLVTHMRWKENGNPNSSVDVDWLGEIVDTCLDGTLTVRLGAASEVQDVNLRREDVVVAIRSDGTDEGDQWGDDMVDDTSDISIGESDGSEAAESDMASEFEEGEVEVRYEDENGQPLDEGEVEDENWESDDEDEDVDMIDAPSQTPPTSHSATPPDDTGSREGPTSASKNSTSQTICEPPEPYFVLEGSACPSHHFAGEASTNNATHMKRIQKEHKILRSATALPNGVYVRTWESRLDLIRVLFVGPAETPYAHAPFVIDFYLGPNFPIEPPQAYFHSWASESSLGGVGRVNPNLYEDGKICLSLLGTWGGNSGESWSAGRSTLLQVIVSLLGLVLVREPYFNEAGYEPMADLESSKRPSALYNERTFLRARTFVITALAWLESEHGVEGTGIAGVDDVVRWLYKGENGQKLLDKVIADADAVLERSEAGKEEVDGLNVVSKGACVPLRRILVRLRQL